MTNPLPRLAPPTSPPGSWRPSRKVSAVALAAALWSLVVAICNQAGFNLSPEVQTTAGGLLSIMAGYWTPEGG